VLINFDAGNSHLQFSELPPLNPQLGRTYSLGIVDLLISMRELATLSVTITLPGVPGANGFITNG
jgi:hypothetical protein